MPISEAHAGRTYPPTAPYPVTAGKIAEFADAIGDPNPCYRGPEAVAPATFVAVASGRAWDAMFTDPELGLALSRIVHGDQRFEFHRAIRPGDELSAILRIDRVRSRPSADIISASAEICSGDERVCTAVATFFHSRPAPDPEPADGERG